MKNTTAPTRHEIDDANRINLSTAGEEWGGGGRGKMERGGKGRGGEGRGGEGREGT